MTTHAMTAHAHTLYAPTAYAGERARQPLPGAALALKLVAAIDGLLAGRRARRKLEQDITHLRGLDLHMLEDLGLDATRLHALHPVIACTDHRG